MRRRFQNEDYLTWVVVAYDDVYLTEPLIRSTEYRLNLAQQVPPYPCTIVTEVVRPDGYVPNWLPGKNDQIYQLLRFLRLAARALLRRRRDDVPRLPPRSSSGSAPRVRAERRGENDDASLAACSCRAALALRSGPRRCCSQSRSAAARSSAPRSSDRVHATAKAARRPALVAGAQEHLDARRRGHQHRGVRRARTACCS